MDRIVRVKVTNHNSGTYIDEEFPGYDEIAGGDVKLKIEESENGSHVMIWYTEEKV
jgi:hypothetical protein